MRAERDRARDRGGALVEAGLILPLLVLMFAGLVEYGLAWRASNAVTDRVGTAALATSRDFAVRTADLRVLEQLRSSSGDLALDGIDWAIVYRTSAPDGGPPAACVAAAELLTSGSGGVPGTCNAYHGSAVASLDDADFDDPACLGDPDAMFCPALRETTVQPGDRLGVAVQVSHSWLTGLIPGTGLTIDDHAVVEPID